MKKKIFKTITVFAVTILLLSVATSTYAITEIKTESTKNDIQKTVFFNLKTRTSSIMNYPTESNARSNSAVNVNGNKTEPYKPLESLGNRNTRCDWRTR